MKNPVRVIAGLRGAISQAERVIEANRYDIAHGHHFEAYLEHNTQRLAELKAKLAQIKDKTK